MEIDESSRSSSKASSQASTLGSRSTTSSSSRRSALKRAQHSYSRKVGVTAFNTLYPDDKAKVSIFHLEPHEMIWLLECLKHPCSTYFDEKELVQRTERLIRALPENLRNPLEGAGFSQASFTRFCAKIGASDETLPQSCILCKKHAALSGQLVSSLRNHIEFVSEDLTDDLTSSDGKALMPGVGDVIRVISSDCSLT